MFNSEAYEAAREALLGDLLRAVGLVAMNLPLAVDEASDLARSRGYHRDHPALKSLADQIEAVEYRFSALQLALGADERITRFGH